MKTAKSCMTGLCALLAVAGAGCAINPVSGDPEVVAVSKGSEIKIGDKAAKQVKEQMGFYEDPSLASYVRSIGARLARFSPRQDIRYTFNIVDMAAPNAFALPGGHVYVSRGLLPLTNSEAELANVMGHEIAHAAARHAVQRVTRMAPIGLAAGLTSMAAGIVSPTLGRAVAQLGGLTATAVLAPYSREQEREADQIGQKMAASAGYDPAAMSTFMRTMEREEELAGAERGPGFLSSHPSTPERVEKTKANAETLAQGNQPPIAGSRAAFLARLDGLVIGEDPTGGLFEDERFLHADLGFTITFPSGWKTANTRSIVGAQAPDGGAVVMLEVQGTGSDPVAAARQFAEQEKVEFASGPEATTVVTQSAAEATLRFRGQSGKMHMDLTWIGLRENIFRVSGVTSESKKGAYRKAFQDVAGSFRGLTSAERDAIQVTRLRPIEARDGETVGDVVARTNGAWTPEGTAANNAVSLDTRLQAGQLIKVAVPERYQPQAR